MKYFVLIITLLLFIFQFNCSTEPEDKRNEDFRLVIQNGYYSKVSRPDDEIQYSFDFEYGVIGDTCYIGGYGIDWDDEKGKSFIDWYKMQKLEPDRIYSICDTFRMSDDISNDPVVSIKGYLGVAEVDTILTVEYQLKRK